MVNWGWAVIVAALLLCCRFLWKRLHTEMDWRFHYTLMWNGLTTELTNDEKAVLRALERKHGKIEHRAAMPRIVGERNDGAGSESSLEADVRITSEGRAFVASAAYQWEIAGLLAQYYLPEGSFYELLLITTAMNICQIDPAKVDRTKVQAFISENLAELRRAIDRMKIFHPAIQLSEDDWDRQRTEK